MNSEQEWDIVSGIGITALAVAAGRAVETSRADALAKDPYAVRFVEEAGSPLPLPTTVAEASAIEGESSAPGVETYVAVRTRAFDDYFQRVLDAGVTQIVLLASGLDTRPFRLPWPGGTVVFETDQPLVLDFKTKVLRKYGATTACDHRMVPVDLRLDWAAALEKAGFDRTRPTAWLAEGLLPYLPPEAEEDLFHEIHRLSAPGSRLAVEYVGDMRQALDSDIIRDNARSAGVDVSDLLHTDQRPAPGARLSVLGWETRDVPAQEAATGYGRPLGPDFLMRNAVYVFARRS
ncbi:SAM-dependent methyltransferase [Streptomyces sp. NPDC051162]|uniref:SAM-dependent methyltransferase n=1 Tax=unclassified Streptomyces TaxID=2593676 RepID=UPI0034411068